MTSFYDVVIIGDELAGAIAGAHLARRGFRVLMLCSAPVERDEIGPFALPRSPLTLCGLESPALKRLVNELNLIQLLRRRVEPNHPAFQILLPDHRLDVSIDDLPRELLRELPEQAAPYDAWAARATQVSEALESLVVEDVTLPPDGFWDRRDLKRMEAQLPSPADGGRVPVESRMVSALPVRFVSDLDGAGAVAEARIWDLHRRGTFHLDGGREGLRSLLLERVRAWAGEVRSERPREIAMRRGRVTGVVMGHGDEVIGCANIVCAMPASELVKLLPEAPPRRLAEAAAVAPAYHRYHLHAVAPLEALPDALGRLVYSVRDLRTWLEGGNLLAVHVQPSHGQHAVLTAEALCRDPSPTGMATLRASMRAHLESIFPFLDRHLAAIWSPHDGLPPELLGAAVPARPALPMDAVWSLPEGRPLGICGIPHATGIKQVLLANRQIIPALGFEGELIAGWGAARLLAAKDKRKLVDKSVLLGGG